MFAKVLGMGVIYVMFQRMVKQHMLKDNKGDQYCASSVCPVMDAGLIDNGPLTPLVQYISFSAASTRSTLIDLTGPANGFSLLQFQFGKAPFDLVSGGGTGVNACPFEQLQVCTMLSGVRRLLVQNLPKDLSSIYQDIGSAYLPSIPENQILAPYCGDPMAFDLMAGECEAQSRCRLLVEGIPGKKMRVQFTVEPLVFLLSYTYLGSTPLSRSFVHDYAPTRLLRLPYFEHMDTWFPAFNVESESKGGLAFLKPAAHPLHDYLTFLTFRLASSFQKNLISGVELHAGKFPRCSYSDAKILMGSALSEVEFLKFMNEKSKQ